MPAANQRDLNGAPRTTNRLRGEAASSVQFRRGGRVSHLIGEIGPESSLDAERILSEHPSLRRSKSAVLDLAYEEYCRRVDTGEAVDVHGFVRRFPGYQTSLLRQIEAHEWLADHSDLLGTPVAWPTQGEEFLGFRLREELGRLAFSRVFLAEELALGQRAVVVKVSRLSGMEPRALGRLRHPHIVPVHSVQFDARSGLSAICMPFFGRATLYDLLDHAFCEGTAPRHGRVVQEAIRRVSACEDPAEDTPRRAARDWWATSYVNAVVRLGIQLSDALEFAHRGGIFHCDIKPSNVLLCPSGVRLFDFNLALGDEAASGRGGTLPYMAPEQLRVLAGKATLKDTASRIDARTDLFSLGVLLYELLSGQLPWGPLPTHLPAERVAEELLGRHERGPKPLRRLAPALNPRLARVFESCLAYRPGDRPATAAEFAVALRREMGWLPRGARFSRVHRRAVLATMGSTILLAGAGGAFWSTIERAPDRHLRIAKEAFRAADYPQAIEHLDLLLKADPENHQVRFWKARALMLQGQPDSAMVELEILEKALPKNPYVTLCEGFCVVATATEWPAFSKAAGLLRDVQERFSDNAAFCNDLGYCETQIFELDAALSWLKKALRRYPSAVVHHNLALAHLKAAPLAQAKGLAGEDHWQKAQFHIAQAIDGAPTITRYYVDRVLIEATAAKFQNVQREIPASALHTVRSCAQEAVAHGASKQDVIRAAFPVLNLASDDVFRVLTEVPAKRSPPTSPTRVLDPLATIDVLSLDLSP